MSNAVQPRRPELLLCDDSLSERTSLARVLRFADFEVSEAPDGEAAIELLKNRTIDLMLLDLNMPQIDGFGVLGYVQEHRKSLPVILLSGMPPDQIQYKIQSLPNRELPPLLIKPIDPDQLLAIIDLQLSGEMPDWQTAAAPAMPD